jgi:DNA-binding PadR family transcriptional regulator
MERSRRLPEAAIHVLVAIGPGERHGYGIMSEVHEMTGGLVRLGPGTLYTTIRRLVDDGLIEEVEGLPAAGEDQRRRYYRLTVSGRNTVAVELRRLERMVERGRAWELAVETGSG